VQKEIDRIVSQYGKEKDANGSFDLEAFEMNIRSGMHGIGCKVLENLLNADGGGYRGVSISCEKGHKALFVDYREKKLLTVLGEVNVNRAYYHDKECHSGFCPKDDDLDIVKTGYSPGVRRLMSKVGAMRPFGLGHQDLHELADIRVTAKEVERQSHIVGDQIEQFHGVQAEAAMSEKVIPIKAVPRMYVSMDGTGVPVVKRESVDRRGKDGGQAKTREAKLGCIFTQTGLDKEGRPIRDEQSTSYIGAIETADDFATRLYKEAKRRGIDRADHVCVIGDGALWIWNIADEQFHGACQIVDLYHAREHYWTVARACLKSKDEQSKWAEDRRLELNEGNVEAVINAIKALVPLPGYDKELCEREIGYFEKNKERMRYADFKKRGMFVGSGVMEAGCRTVVGQRLKQSGMHWTVRGANNIIALRCSLLSNRWEDFWEYRAAA
jgi:hypothetical protein